ncbi:hypothetical protein [Streptomyces sp. NPDC057702]|uniref:hypothetical protein n=1 Tax=unclassified Streptomyces TaxID=2593676 RepID=UPI0036A90454
MCEFSGHDGFPVPERHERLLLLRKHDQPEPFRDGPRKSAIELLSSLGDISGTEDAFAILQNGQLNLLRRLKRGPRVGTERRPSDPHEVIAQVVSSLSRDVTLCQEGVELNSLIAGLAVVLDLRAEGVVMIGLAAHYSPQVEGERVAAIRPRHG